MNMKIQGVPSSKVNPYQKHLKQQTEITKRPHEKDQIKISKEAKQLQQAAQFATDSADRVQKIKQAVEKGQYSIDYEKTAEKLIAYWSNKS